MFVFVSNNVGSGRFLVRVGNMLSKYKHPIEKARHRYVAMSPRMLLALLSQTVSHFPCQQRLSCILSLAMARFGLGALYVNYHNERCIRCIAQHSTSLQPTFSSQRIRKLAWEAHDTGLCAEVGAYWCLLT